MRTAHGTGFGEDGISERLIAFHEARARGGPACRISSNAAVTPSPPRRLPEPARAPAAR